MLTMHGMNSFSLCESIGKLLYCHHRSTEAILLE